MREVDAYDVLDELMDQGDRATLRELAESFKEPGDETDVCLVRLEEMLRGYKRICTKIGEEPVVIFDELIDEVTSSAFSNATDLIFDAKERLMASNKAWISYYLRRMSWQRFEDFCGELLDAMGVSDVRLTNRGPDNGIDFTGTFFNPSFEDMIFPVIGQAKHYRARSLLNVNDVRNMIGKLSIHEDHAVQGFLITTSDFRQDARDEADQSPRRLHLWNMGQLTRHVEESMLGFDVNPSELHSLDASYWERFLED